MRNFAYAIIGTAALAAIGVAQGPRRGGFGPQTPYTLVTRKDVGKELKLTDDESMKLQTAQADMRQQMGQAMQDAQGDFEAMGKARIKISDAYSATVKTTISADQFQRLLQLFIQREGNMSVLDPDVQKLVKLGDEKSKKVNELQSKQNTANADIFKKMMSGEMDRQDVFPAIQKNGEILKTEVEKLLTDDNKAAIKTAGGTAFEFDKSEDPPPFGRPPGGGGGGGR